jgi:hypothetical protein
MNIIQMQDKLKDLSNKQLMYYIENPQVSSGAMTGSSLGQGGANTLPGAMLAGHVPAYLVIGELGRREETRAKYQAQAQPTQTVAEEIIAKVAPQTGIGALTNSMAAPQMPQPEVMSESETISETGIANLPAPNVGNYADGGIVGYGVGGKILDFTKKIITKPMPKALPGGTSNVPALRPGLINRNPIKSGILGTAGAYYILSDDGEEIAVSDQDVEAMTNEGIVSLQNETVEEVPTPTALDTAYDKTPRQVGEGKAKMLREMLGTDPYAAKQADRMAKMEQRITDREDQLVNDALIRAGIAMMGSKSPNFMQGLAEGAGAGMESYTAGLDDVASRQDKMFELESAIAQSRRAEEVAIATKGFGSMEAEEARRETRELENIKLIEAQKERDKDIEIAEIGSTLHGYNSKTNSAVLAREKAMGIEALYTERNNTSRMAEGPEKQKALKRIDAEILRIQNQARIAIGGNSQQPSKNVDGGMQLIGNTPDGRKVFQDSNGNQFVSD